MACVGQRAFERSLFPAPTTRDAESEGRHRFVSAACLELRVGRFTGFAFLALQSAVRHGLEVMGELFAELFGGNAFEDGFPQFRVHFVRRHGTQLSWIEGAVQHFV